MINHLPANWVEVIIGRSLTNLYCFAGVIVDEAEGGFAKGVYEGFGVLGTFGGEIGAYGALTTGWTIT